MLRIGLTGGIGSGKSSVARLFAERGAVIVDADAIARAVVAPGTRGLAAVAERFGADVLGADGALDRAALAGVVFGDAAALAALEGITHPLIWAEAARQFAAVPADGIVVHEMPLLVEKVMSAEYHLVIVVLTDTELRVRRLVEHRGLDESDARRRIAAQVDDDARRAAADVLLDNNGTPAALAAQAGTLWDSRILPFATNLTAGRPATVRDFQAEYAAQLPREISAQIPGQIRRMSARIAAAVGVGVIGGTPTGDGAIGSGVSKGVVAGEPTGQPAIGESSGVLEFAVPVPAWPDGAAYQRLAAAGFPVLDAQGDRLGNCDPAWPARIRLVPPRT